MRQQVEQIVVLQALLAARGGTETVFPKPNAKFNVEVAKSPMFNRDTSKVIGFVMIYKLYICHMQVHLSGNNIPMVKPPPNHTSPPFTAAIFLATCLMAVLQPSGYSIFHRGDTPIQLGLP